MTTMQPIYVAPPTAMFWVAAEIPAFIQTAIQERKAQQEKARQDTDPGTIIEKERRAGYLDPSDFSEALICAGIGKQAFPRNDEVFTYLICGGAVTALNAGHIPKPRVYGGWEIDLFTIAYDLLCSSLPSTAEVSPLHPHILALLVELFRPDYDGGHYREGVVYSDFIRYNRLTDYIRSFESWTHLRPEYTRKGQEVICDLPEWAWADTEKIVAGISQLVEATNNWHE